MLNSEYMNFKSFSLVCLCSVFIFSACSANSNSSSNKIASSSVNNQSELEEILNTQKLNEKQRYSIINQMASNYRGAKDYQGLVLFLTDWVEQNPDDMYNSYWLLMTADAYRSMGAEPVAEYYFDRILQQCPDKQVKRR